MQVRAGGGVFAGPGNIRGILALGLLGVFSVAGAAGLVVYLFFSSHSDDGAIGEAGAPAKPAQAMVAQEPGDAAQITGAVPAAVNVKVSPGSAVFIRLFKESGQMEVWAKEGERFALVKTIALCRRYKELGPRRNGPDARLPEGFYHVTAGLLRWSQSKRADAIPLGFPNTYDLGRGYSGKAVHITAGCEGGEDFAISREDMKGLDGLVQGALKGGQSVFAIHVYPFRMSWQRLLAEKGHEDYAFWLNLKEAHSYFDEERVLPKISVCGLRYWVGARSGGAKRAGADRGDCLPLLPASEVPYDIAKHHAWLKRALEEHKLAYWMSKRAISSIEVKCNLKRPSCRRWYNLRKKMVLEGKVPRELTGGR